MFKGGIGRLWRREPVRIGLAAVLLGAAVALGLTLGHHHPAAVALHLLAWLPVGLGVAVEAVRRLLRRRGLDETFLMTVASVGAFVLGEGTEAVLVMLLYALGEWLEGVAIRRSRRSIAALTAICPDEAVVVRAGEAVTVDAEEVAVGEELLLRPGARVAVDCRITVGEGTADLSAITGESRPLGVEPGDTLPAGAICGSSLLRAEALRPAEQSAAARILELVETAGERKSRQEAFVSRFARVYTPAVVALALVLAVVPPLLTGFHFLPWCYRALTLLVVSCPCALVISVPLSFFGGIGGGAKRGVLYKGGNLFAPLSRATVAVLDKTGTLTTGRFRLADIRSQELPDEKVLFLAASAEAGSDHPLAKAICREAARQGIQTVPLAVRERPGLGVIAQTNGGELLVGGARLLASAGIKPPLPPKKGVGVYLALRGECVATLVLQDECRPGMVRALAELRRLGIRETVMLTGDTEANARPVAEALGIHRVYAGLLPEEKLARLEELQAAHPRGVLYVGDGINDAPALARADVGVAMGEGALDAAVEAADVVIPSNRPDRLPLARRIARRTLRIAKENIALALGVKGAVLLLTAFGLLPEGIAMACAIFADVGVCLLAVLNALRTLR